MPTKELLIQAGYNENDLKNGINYMSKGKARKLPRLLSSIQKHKISKSIYSKGFSTNGDLKAKPSPSSHRVR